MCACGKKNSANQTSLKSMPGKKLVYMLRTPDGGQTEYETEKEAYAAQRIEGGKVRLVSRST